MTTERKLEGFVLIVAFLFVGSSAEVHIMVHSSARAPVTVGQSVFLTCEFHRPGNCSWTRNALAVTINDRYKYMYFDIGENIQRKNCLIGIAMVKVEDAGNWTCAIKAKPNETGIFSKSAYLHVKENDKGSGVGKAVMIAVIVIQAVIIAAFLTYKLCTTRARAANELAEETNRPDHRAVEYQRDNSYRS